VLFSKLFLARTMLKIETCKTNTKNVAFLQVAFFCAFSTCVVWKRHNISKVTMGKRAIYLLVFVMLQLQSLFYFYFRQTISRRTFILSAWNLRGDCLSSSYFPIHQFSSRFFPLKINNAKLVKKTLVCICDGEWKIGGKNIGRERRFELYWKNCFLRSERESIIR